MMIQGAPAMRPAATVADARAFFEDDHIHMP